MVFLGTLGVGMLGVIIVGVFGVGIIGVVIRGGLGEGVLVVVVLGIIVVVVIMEGVVLGSVAIEGVIGVGILKVYFSILTGFVVGVTLVVIPNVEAIKLSPETTPVVVVVEVYLGILIDSVVGEVLNWKMSTPTPLIVVTPIFLISKITPALLIASSSVPVPIL